MAQKNYLRWVQFYKDRASSDWQQTLTTISLLGTMATMLLLLVSLVAAVWLGDSLFARITLPCFVVATAVACLLYVKNRESPIPFGGVLLVFLYVALAIAMMYKVGIGAGAAILFAVAIILASALYGFWFALLPTTVSTAALILLRLGELQGNISPNYVYVPRPHNFDAVVALIILLHILAVACGVVHHYLVQAYQRLQTSEAEKLQQLYRFAEIGEVSTALVHDLANSLSSLSLEVEAIEPTSDARTTRALKRKIKRLNKALSIAREQMKGHHRQETFDIAREISQIVTSLQLVASKANVLLEWKRPPDSFPYSGEKLLFQQVLAILIKNAIDSYTSRGRSSRTPRCVRIALSKKDTTVQLVITDWGKGIKPNERNRIFEPFYSTKTDGMGLGLYLTKRFIEDSFGGRLSLHTPRGRTEFSIHLPQQKAT